MRRSLLPIAALFAALACAPAAAAADTVVAADPAAEQVSALDGTVVWVSGKFGSQVLMQHTPAGGATRVEGAPQARSYHSIDLGRDGGNRLVLTYERCDTSKRCRILRDDLDGGRRSFKRLALARCSLTTAPALWRSRTVYGLLCRKGRTADPERSGLYVKTGTRKPRRLPLPKDAVKFGVDEIEAVDVRGTQVAAVAADIFEYAFTESAGGKRIESFLAAASEGDSDAHARGLALGSVGTMWTLTTSSHTGDPNEARLQRLAGGCLATERIVTPAGPDAESAFLATDVAADGTALHLVVPGTGIVRHDFAPEGPCVPR